MPLQNRVDPFGEIHAVAARGLFTGNRGVIHDPASRTLLKRRWSTKAWIVCVCDYRGRKRDVMGRNAPSGNAGWTELFFLDEVTALAAGHRPCFFCQREKAREFADCFGKAFGMAKPKAAEMDARLHVERLASASGFRISAPSFSGLSRESARRGDRPRIGERCQPQQSPGTSPRMTKKLDFPNGAMIRDGNAAYALRGGRIFQWSFTGYTDRGAIADRMWHTARLITPRSTVAVLNEGFEPIWHPGISVLS